MKKRNWMAGVCGAAVIGLLIVGTGTALDGKSDHFDPGRRS